MKPVLHKILFIGPMGAGKTTAIAAISDETPITTEAANSDDSQSVKATTTVALDYGSIELENNLIQLYGIPGQLRFRFMWPILSIGALGCIVLIDETRPEPLHDLQIYLKEFEALIKRGAFVVGINKTAKDGTALAKYSEYFANQNLYPPLFEVDVRSKRDVLMLLELLLINQELD